MNFNSDIDEKKVNEMLSHYANATAELYSHKARFALSKKEYKRARIYLEKISHLESWELLNSDEVVLMQENVEQALLNDIMLPQKEPLAEKKILGLYDFAAQPYSVGDFVVFLRALQVLKDEMDVDGIDVAVIVPGESIGGNGIFNDRINTENRLYSLYSILPLQIMNADINTVLIFTSVESYNNYLNTHKCDYVSFWPTLDAVKANSYAAFESIKIMNHIFENKSTIVSYLRVPGFLKQWAKSFFSANARGRVPVTVNMRRNEHHPWRNADVEVWTKFFQQCEAQYPVTFFVVGSKNEIFTEIKSLSNVIFVKESCTSIEQDTALIMTSPIHMGVGSGLGSVRSHFGVGNSVQFKSLYCEDRTIPEAWKKLLTYRAPSQIAYIYDPIDSYWFVDDESVDQLIYFMEKLLVNVDVDKYLYETLNVSDDPAERTCLR